MSKLFDNFKINLTLICILGACTFPQKKMEFNDCPKNFKVVYAERSQTEEACNFIPGVSKLDNGEVSDPGSQICGCWDYTTNTIRLAWGCITSFWHELAHACGVKDPAKSGYNF